MSKGTLTINDKMPALLKAMSLLVQSEVLVGIPAQTTERSDGEPINNATLGYIHENGAPAAGIPARPFLVPGVAAAEEDVADQLAKGATAALAGDKTGIDQRLHAAGLIATSSVKNGINAGIDPALADATIAARQRKGRTRTTPLVDTGAFRESIKYVVRRK